MNEYFLALGVRHSSGEGASPMQSYDVVIIGAGHNAKE
jgi:hypothetical protein